MKSKEVGRKASEYFSQGYLCSEAVLMAVCEALDISSPHIPAIATAFGSGMARTNDACGAFNGAVLALSMIYGREDTKTSYEDIYTKVALLKDQFNTQFTSCECSALLGFSLSDSDAKEKFSAQNCKEKCLNFVAFGAEAVFKIVSEDKKGV